MELEHHLVLDACVRVNVRVIDSCAMICPEHPFGVFVPSTLALNLRLR